MYRRGHQGDSAGERLPYDQYQPLSTLFQLVLVSGPGGAVTPLARDSHRKERWSPAPELRGYAGDERNLADRARVVSTKSEVDVADEGVGGGGR